MKREIKFRFYDPEEKTMMTSGMEVDFTGSLCVFMGNNECPIMQFTGLLDKNGKEIYEGDFVMFGTTRLEVIWDENRVGFATLDINRKDMGGMQNKKGRFGEIIGNIYENPNLINHA